MDEIEILTEDDGIKVTKENGTMVDYFIFDEYEIHLNKIKPNSKQKWHRHENIEEVIVVTKGEITLRWIEGKEKKIKKVTKGSLVRVKKSIHTLENRSESFSEFIVYRMVLTGKDNKEIIKNDKILIDEGQINI